MPIFMNRFVLYAYFSNLLIIVARDEFKSGHIQDKN